MRVSVKILACLFQDCKLALKLERRADRAHSRPEPLCPAAAACQGAAGTVGRVPFVSNCRRQTTRSPTPARANVISCGSAFHTWFMAIRSPVCCGTRPSRCASFARCAVRRRSRRRICSASSTPKVGAARRKLLSAMSLGPCSPSTCKAATRPAPIGMPAQLPLQPHRPSCQ